MQGDERRDEVRNLMKQIMGPSYKDLNKVMSIVPLFVVEMDKAEVIDLLQGESFAGARHQLHGDTIEPDYQVYAIDEDDL